MLIVANWKAYVEDVAKAKALVASAKKNAARSTHEIVLAPQAVYLALLSSGKSKLAFAAQDVSETLGGAATGELTAGAYASAGATYAIIGHSERRAMGEQDDHILKKIQHAFAHGLTPILCVGERERDADAKYLQAVRAQLSHVYAALSPKERLALVLAYEPVWAIGKSAAEALPPSELSEMVLYLRKVLADFIPGRGNTRVRVLYGGSVEPENARDLAAQGIDGFLIGHASVAAPAFAAIVRSLS